jgi:hypothetical protein
MKTTYDFERIWESKRALRRRLRAAPIIEKLRMLDALHERAAAIRGARFREATAVQEKPGRYGDRKEKTPSTP